jgi:hypothetical protein
VVFDSNGKRMESPEKAESPLKLKQVRQDAFVGKKVSALLSSNTKKAIRQLDSSLVTPEKAVRRRTNTLNSTMVKKDQSSLRKAFDRPIDERAELQKSAGKQIQNSIKLLQNTIRKVNITQL